MQTLEDQVWAGKRIVCNFVRFGPCCGEDLYGSVKHNLKARTALVKMKLQLTLELFIQKKAAAQRIAPRISLPISSDTVDPKRCGFTETQAKTTKLQTFCQDPFLERIAEEKLRLRIRHFLRLSSQLMEEVG